MARAVGEHLHGYCPLALQDHPLHQGIVHDVQVGPAAHRVQVGEGAIPTHASGYVDREGGHAPFLVGIVELWDLGDSYLSCTFEEGDMVGREALGVRGVHTHGCLCPRKSRSHRFQSQPGFPILAQPS